MPLRLRDLTFKEHPMAEEASLFLNGNLEFPTPPSLDDVFRTILGSKQATAFFHNGWGVSIIQQPRHNGRSANFYGYIEDGTYEVGVICPDGTIHEVMAWQTEEEVDQIIARIMSKGKPDADGECCTGASE
jgi:hypothetical protein